jgi:hypothetical protein
MLINRLYKSKNTPANNKQLPKPEQDTNLLFYVIPFSLSKPKKNPSEKNNPRKYFLSSAAPDGPPFSRKFHPLMCPSDLHEGLREGAPSTRTTSK